MKQNYEANYRELYKDLSRDFFAILELCRKIGLTFSYSFKAKEWSVLHNENEIVREKLSNLSKEFRELNENFEDLSDDYFTLKAEYDELKEKYKILSRFIRL